MFRTITAVSLFALLSACGDGQPFSFEGLTQEDVDPDVEEVNGIPAALAGNLNGVTYNPSNKTLLVEISSLDSTPISAKYNRDDRFDVPGYIAFTKQEDPLDRMFVGFVDRTADGGAQAVLVHDGGQFGTFFAGTSYSQVGAYSPHNPRQPNNGLATYAGEYVGALNAHARGDRIAGVPDGTAPAVRPGEPVVVTGDVFINADFADMSLNGTIYNRDVALIPGLELEDVFLHPTTVDGNGVFGGEINNTENKGVGTFGGNFGGNGATGVAGSVYMDGDFISAVDDEIEYGIFVLDKCGTPASVDICSAVNPNANGN